MVLSGRPALKKPRMASELPGPRESHLRPAGGLPALKKELGVHKRIGKKKSTRRFYVRQWQERRGGFCFRGKKAGKVATRRPRTQEKTGTSQTVENFCSSNRHMVNLDSGACRNALGGNGSEKSPERT